MLSSDTKYLLKLRLSKNKLLTSLASSALLLTAKTSIGRNRHWSFCKFLGKYEKLNEDLILEGNASAQYHQLKEARISFLEATSPNPIYKNFLASVSAKAIQKMYSAFSPDDRVRIRYQNEDDPQREGNLLILKEPERLSEDHVQKGVLYLQYNNSIIEFAALFDLEKLYKDYVLIVEPSSWGYSDIGLELLLHGNNLVYVMAQDSRDYDICKQLDERLIPVRAGAGDWIDLDVQQTPDNKKLFDVCMVASWRKLKNHELLFKQLSSLGAGLRIALIGYPWERRSAASIRREQSKYYPDSLVSIFECVPHEYVFRVLSQSRVALMLSEREGANRGIYEALASNVPVVMLSNNRGVNKALVEAGCVITTPAANLGTTVNKLLKSLPGNDVRQRLLHISGANNTWAKINEALKLNSGVTLDAEPIIRSTPNLKYINPHIKTAMDAKYEQLKAYLYS